MTTLIVASIAINWGCVPSVTLRDDKADAASGGSRDASASGGSPDTSIIGGGGTSGAGFGSGGTTDPNEIGMNGGSPASGGGMEASTQTGANGGSSAGGRDAGDLDAQSSRDARSDADALPPPSCPGTVTYHGDFDRSSPTSTVLTDVSIASMQNILLGASNDGKTLLVKHGCYPEGSRWLFDGSVWLYDGDLETRTYTGVDITPQLAGFDDSEGHMSLAPDGLTLVFNRNPIGFALKQRKDRHSTVFLNVDDSNAFGRVNDWALTNASEVVDPLLSGDGLSFFFAAHLFTDPSTWRFYEVRREHRGDVFLPPEERIPGMDENEDNIWGVSPDRLTIFARDAHSFATKMFVRPRLGAPFQPVEPQIASTRSMPIGDDCGRLLGVGTIGGCGTEEIFVLTPH